jgi:acyl-CoA synthetase (AMP-forming)/AMP-acid ligase II
MVTNLASLWEGVAAIASERPAVVAGDRVLSWAEFTSDADRLAGGLAALGVSQGQSVAVMARNSPEYAVALFATLKLAAAPVNVNFRYTPDELTYLLDDCDSRVLICDRDLVDTALSASARTRSAVTVIAIGGDGADDRALAFGDVGDDARAPAVDRSGDDRILLYTGGTTGPPKGVVWSHSALFEMMSYNTYTAFGLAAPTDEPAAMVAAQHALTTGVSPVSLLASPLTHATALFMATSTWLLGGTVVFLTGRRFDADELLTAIEVDKVSQLVMVGDVFGRPVADALDVAAARGGAYDISSLKRIASAGVLWSSSVKSRLAAHGPITMIDVLGASEGGPYALAVVPPGVDPSSVRFVLGDRAAVLTDDGSLVRAGDEVVGSLAVRGPIPTGYLNDPERSAATFQERDGERWSVPGDRAVLHADGTITLLGRGSLVINTGGEKVHREEVEQALLDEPAIRDAAVVGLPDDLFGEIVAAAVVATKPVEPETLRRFLATRLAGYKLPRQFCFVDEIPRSPVGKVDYAGVRALFDSHAVATGQNQS